MSPRLPARRWRRVAVAAVCAATAALQPLAASASPIVLWTQQRPATSPLGRAGAMTAYDAARGQVVLFGGYNVSTLLNDTWTWDGVTWTQRHPATSPPARWFAGTAYDAVRRQVVLFGGESGSGSSHGDTWTWDGVTWTRHTPPASPPARSGHGMAYDAVRGRVVLFGGWSWVPFSYTYFADTWTWNGTTWTQHSPVTVPAARFGAAMAYHETAGKVVLFGGNTGSAVTADTWTWDGTNWSPHAPSSSPPERAYAVTAYDGRGRVLVFGGYGGPLGNDLADTWVWDGVTWSVPAVAAGPAPREFSTGAYDAKRRQVVMFSGNNSSPVGGGHVTDTWTYSDPLPA